MKQQKKQNQINLQVVLPVGSFGRATSDNYVETFLRDLAVKIEGDDQNWASKYGTNFENELLLYHRYCWCESEDCPWCLGCQCPPEAFKIYLDKQLITNEAYYLRREQEVGTPPEMEASAAVFQVWQEKNRAFERRTKRKHLPLCDFCRTGGQSLAFGGGPGQTAPNFWFKPTNFKVWFYKYIGRSMNYINRPNTLDLLKIQQLCEASLLPQLVSQK